jgi:hypothetical protein
MKTRLHAIFAAISSAILMDVDETTFVNVQMRIHILRRILLHPGRSLSVPAITIGIISG